MKETIKEKMNNQVVKNKDNNYITSVNANMYYLVKGPANYMSAAISLGIAGMVAGNDFGMILKDRNNNNNFFVGCFDGITNGNRFMFQTKTISSLVDVLISHNFEIFEYESFSEMITDYLKMSTK